jgi:hypothetical protein
MDRLPDSIGKQFHPPKDETEEPRRVLYEPIDSRELGAAERIDRTRHTLGHAYRLLSWSLASIQRRSRSAKIDYRGLNRFRNYQRRAKVRYKRAIREFEALRRHE